MSKTEIVEKLVKVHNLIAQIPVSGEATIAMSSAIIELRQMVANMQEEIQSEKEKDGVDETK